MLASGARSGIGCGAGASRVALTRMGRAMFAATTQALPPPAPLKRGNQLVGYSLVVGLNGTGDAPRIQMGLNFSF